MNSSDPLSPRPLGGISRIARRVGLDSPTLGVPSGQDDVVTERMRVELTEEHLRTMRKSATTGLLELVKNGLDAGARNVTVSFKREPQLGAVEGVTVVDDGFGMNREQVNDYFRPLSTSWKRGASRRGRPGEPAVERDLFGRRGEGRLTAFAIGSSVTWTTAWGDGDELRAQRIVWNEEPYDEFGVSSLEVGADGFPSRSGTRVEVRSVAKNVERLTSEKTRALLESKLGVFLEKYQDTTVVLDGRPLDVANLQVRRTPLTVVVPEETASTARFAGCSATAEVEVVEWSIPAAAGLWLADPLDKAPLAVVGVHETHPGISFTAWLRWDGWSRLEDLITVPELSGEALPLIDAAREVLAQHLRERSNLRAAALLQDWKEEGSYPYDGEPASETERAERELFDIVAVTAAPALDRTDALGRSFSLRLLAEAVRTDQSQLGTIFREVLALDEEQLNQLERLLNRAPLSAVVEISHIVFQRKTFLDWLQTLLFDEKWAKALLETPGLHQILAANTWIFGDKWTLVADEPYLTTVARKHEEMLATVLDDDTAYDSDEQKAEVLQYDIEVLDPQGKRRRLDLLLVQANGRTSEPHYFVVELKRPSRRLTASDLNQVENYMDALGKHPAFSNPSITWTFLLVGKDCVDRVERRRTEDGRPHGLAATSKFQSGAEYELWVRTWSEMLLEANQRLDFVRDALAQAPSTAAEFEALHQLHRDVLPPLDDA